MENVPWNKKWVPLEETRNKLREELKRLINGQVTLAGVKVTEEEMYRDADEILDNLFGPAKETEETLSGKRLLGSSVSRKRATKNKKTR